MTTPGIGRSLKTSAVELAASAASAAAAAIAHCAPPCLAVNRKRVDCKQSRISELRVSVTHTLVFLFEGLILGITLGSKV